jgi:hypothetical protein
MYRSTLPVVSLSGQSQAIGPRSDGLQGKSVKKGFKSATWYLDEKIKPRA